MPLQGLTAVLVKYIVCILCICVFHIDSPDEVNQLSCKGNSKASANQFVYVYNIHTFGLLLMMFHRCGDQTASRR